MRISFLLPHTRLTGGVKVLLEYANRLMARGHETIIFIAANRPKWYQFRKKRELEKSGIKSIEPESIDWFFNHVQIFEVPKFGNQHLPDADILMVSSWQTALVSAARDVSAMAENLNKATKDLTLKQRLSENGYRKILELNWDTNVDQLEKWFVI